MKIGWTVMAVAAFVAVVAADPALARVKHKARAHCVDRPYDSPGAICFDPATGAAAEWLFAAGLFLRQVYRPGS